MDTRRFIMAMTLAMVVLYGYTFYVQRQQAKQQAAQTQAAAATQPHAASKAASQAGSTQSAEATQSAWRAVGAAEARPVTLGQDDPASTYNIQAFLTSRGAAVQRVLMVEKSDKKTKDGKPKYEYAKEVDGLEPYPVLEPLSLPDGRQVFSWQTASVRIGDPAATVPLANVNWNVETVPLADGVQQVKFWVDIVHGEQPVVRITKSYTLTPDQFAIDMDLTFQSLGLEEVQLVVDQLGPVNIHSEDPQNDLRKVFVVAKEKDKPRAQIHQHSSLAGQPAVEIGSAVPFWWTAMVDKYFAAITAPEERADGPKAVSTAKVFSYSSDPKAKDGGAVAVEMASPVVTVPVGGLTQLNYDLYVGPKDPDIFAASATYVARDYNILRSSEYAWCTCSSLGELMTIFLHWLYWYIPPHNYGVAIIILVLLVRVLLHPLTKHQQIAMADMQAKQAAVAPKIAALKQKLGNDRQKLQLETMRVYREAGINPAGQMAGCLPMLIQLPIWVALYSALNYDINLWHEPFALWIRDLSAPDTLYKLKSAVNIPVLSWMIGPVDRFNLLPILLAVSMWLQQKYTPKAPPAPGTPQEQIDQQAQMQKMMGFMMIFMGTLFYNMPSGLNLYIMASSFFGVLESQRIRKHIQERANRPASQKREPSWMDRIMEKVEKRAADSRTIRKDKPQQ